MKKLIATLLMLALILSLACPMSLAEGDKVKLALAYHNQEPVTLPDGSVKPQLFEALIAMFEEDNPDVEIEYIPLPTDTSEELTKLDMMAASDTLPDMFIFTYMVAADYNEAGLIANLTPYISDEMKSRLYPSAFDYIKKALDTDDIYFFPIQTEAQGWFYNKALFDQCGLEIPETWDDFINCVKVFKENDILPIAHGGADSWDLWGYYPIWWRNGYEEELPALLSGELKFSDSKSWRASFEYVHQLAELGAYPENVTTMSNTAALETFLGGVPLCTPAAASMRRNLTPAPS